MLLKELNCFLEGKIMTNKKISVHSITLFSIVGFYVWMTLYALSVYKQFSFYEIISVSMIFFILIFLLIKFFVNDFFNQRIYFNIYNILLSAVILIFMIVLQNTPNIKFLDYFSTFPLLETELGLGWVADSTFHSSLIQNIINFGYPSIGQHGTPLTIYHILSHYIDAAIIVITGLEVYDSYGLFFHFKSFCLIISIVFFVSKVINSNNAFIFLFSLFLIAPAVIGTWHAIGSHGLWFTSILIIISSFKVFKILSKEGNNSFLDFLFLFLLIVVISLGKISSGFTYAVIIGFILLFKQPKNKWVYILGIGWVVFFIIYSKFVSPSGSSMSLEHLRFFYEKLITHHMFSYSIYSSITVFCILAVIKREKFFISPLVSVIVTYMILSLILSVMPSLSSSDSWYFYYGFNSVMFLLLIHYFFAFVNSYKKYEYQQLNVLNKRIVIICVGVSLILLSNFYYKSKLNLKKELDNKQIYLQSEEIIYTTNKSWNFISPKKRRRMSLPILNLEPDNSYIVRININVSQNAKLELYYTDANTINKPYFAVKGRYVKTKLLKGKNDIYLKLNYKNLGKHLRFYPVSTPGIKVDVNSFSIKKVKKDFSWKSLNIFNTGYIFSKINTKLDDNRKMELFDDFFTPRNSITQVKFKRPLLEFRKGLLDFLSSKRIDKKNSVLFLSKEIFEKEIVKFNGNQWARGMLMYSVTGVPLVNGINALRNTYGYHDYDINNVWMNKKKFNPEKTCGMISSKYIVITEKFTEPRFSLYLCERNN